jgi:hypothetical protein
LQLYQLPYIVPELVLSTLHREKTTSLCRERESDSQSAGTTGPKKKRKKKFKVCSSLPRILILEYSLTYTEGLD